jgi:hypothetical protein
VITALFALMLGGRAAAQPSACGALTALLLPDVKITEVRRGRRRDQRRQPMLMLAYKSPSLR